MFTEIKDFHRATLFINYRNRKSFDRNGMETCGLKSSFSLSSNLCQEFCKKTGIIFGKTLLVWKEKVFVASITQLIGTAGCFSLFSLHSFAFYFFVGFVFFHPQQQYWWPELLWSRLDWSASLCIGLLPPIWRISVFTLSLANVLSLCMIFDLVNIKY